MDNWLFSPDIERGVGYWIARRPAAEHADGHLHLFLAPIFGKAYSDTFLSGLIDGLIYH